MVPQHRLSQIPCRPYGRPGKAAQCLVRKALPTAQLVKPLCCCSQSCPSDYSVGGMGQPQLTRQCSTAASSLRTRPTEQSTSPPVPKTGARRPRSTSLAARGHGRGNACTPHSCARPCASTALYLQLQPLIQATVHQPYLQAAPQAHTLHPQQKPTYSQAASSPAHQFSMQAPVHPVLCQRPGHAASRC